MSTDKVQQSTEGGATHANKDINGLMSLNGVLSDKSGTETNAHQSSEEVMVDSVLWAKANRSQQHRTSGNSLLCTNKALQMMASSGFRTRRMDSPDNGVVSLDDVDVIDLDVLNLDEEDGWLFRLTQPAKDSPSPYAWVRRDFDLKDVGTPRGSLLQTLEQATKKKASSFNSSRLCNTVLSPSGSSDTLSNVLDNGCSANTDAVCKTLDYGCTTDSDNAFNSRDNGDVTCPETVCNILNNGSVTNKGNLCNVPAYSETTPKSKGRYEIDTRTFTRPKKSAKNNNNNNNRDSGNSLVNPVRLSPESSEPGDSEDVGLAIDAAGCGSSESQCPPAVEDTLKDEQFLKLEDVTDVQVLARMQEDSLRRSYSSPVGYTPKSQRRGLPNSPSRLTQGLSNGSLTCHSDVSSPTLSHADPLGITKSTNSLSSASSESSTSRSDSFTNVNASQVQNSRGFSETHQHSLPNLSKTAKFSVPRSVPSDSKLYASPGSRSLPVSASSRAKSLEISISKKTPLTEQSDVSSSSVVDPVPAKPKSPTPASKPVSGIPKPNTTSRLRQPAKWKKNLTMPTQNDGNWREGCF